MRCKSRIVVAVTAIVAACSEPAGPCDATFACQIGGADLAVIELRIVSGRKLGTDPVTRLPVYAREPIQVEITIVNRGDTASAVSGDIPSLEPGEVFRTTTTRTPPPYARQDWNDAADSRADMDYVSYGIPTDDADNSNNGGTLQFHVARPVIAARGSLGQRTELRANEPFVISFRVENRTSRDVPLDSVSVVLCTVDWDLGCFYAWPYFARVDLPRVDPGWRYENAYVATMPMSAMAYPERSRLTELRLCVIPSATDRPHIPSSIGHSHCVRLDPLILRPDFESCNPPTLVLGETVTLSEFNCLVEPNPSPAGPLGLSAVALDADAERTYFVTAARTYSVVDADGNAADLPGPGLRFATSGRYYLLFDSAPLPYTVTLTLIE